MKPWDLDALYEERAELYRRERRAAAFLDWRTATELARRRAEVQERIDAAESPANRAA